MKTLKIRINERISSDYFPYLAKLGKVTTEKTGAKDLKKEVIEKLKEAGYDAISIVLVTLQKQFYIFPVKLGKFGPGEKAYNYTDFPEAIKQRSVKVIQTEKRGGEAIDIDIGEDQEAKDLAKEFFEGTFINNDPTVRPAIKADKVSYKIF